MGAVRQAFAIPGFWRLAGTYTANDLADALATIALAILVFDRTHSAIATTALFLFEKFLPAFVVPALSARLDLLAPARVLAFVYVALAVALGASALAAQAFFLPVVLLLALAVGCLAATARALTRSANVALLEPAGKLREGNATLNIGFAVSSAGGPIVAGALVAVIGSGAVLAITAALFLIEAVVIARAQLTSAPEDLTPWRDRLRDGLAYVRRHPTLRTLLGGQALAFALLTMVTPVEVVFAKATLGAGSVGFGALLTAWGVGMLVGSAVFTRERHRPVAVLIVGATVLMALGYLGMAAAPGIVVACAASALGGIGNGVQWVAVVTALQEATEERYQARVAGLLEAVLTAAPGVGYLVGGGLTALLSPRVTFAAAGGGVLLVLAVAAVVLRGGRARDAAAAAGADEASGERAAA